MQPASERKSTPLTEAADPLEVLMREHETAIEYLSRLENAAKYIHTNGFSFEAFMQISKTLRFIGIEIQCHNEKEEKYLFRLLDRHSIGSQQSMREEHRELKKLYTRLSQSVEDVEEGRIHTNIVQELLEASNALIEHLRKHISTENEVLFPLARKVLTKDELVELRKNISTETT